MGSPQSAQTAIQRALDGLRDESGPRADDRLNDAEMLYALGIVAEVRTQLEIAMRNYEDKSEPITRTAPGAVVCSE